MKRKPLYIETLIAGDMEALWARTQEPVQHALWDLRFSEIEYLPKGAPEDPQKFLYATRIGFGLKVEGIGESVAARKTDGGESISVLKFSSDSPISIIEEGTGFWKYQPMPQGIRFFTGYDYRTRWGWAGAAFDKWVFRPLMVWATAWSFDRLKNWIEKGIHPRQAMAAQLTVTCASLAAGLVWAYQGLIPKLLFKDTGEMSIVAKSGWFPGREALMLDLLGWTEIGFGVLLVLFQRRRLPHWINLAALFLLGAAALHADPGVYIQPFNPFTLNLATMALSAAALFNLSALPRASHCRTTPP